MSADIAARAPDILDDQFHHLLIVTLLRRLGAHVGEIEIPASEIERARAYQAMVKVEGERYGETFRLVVTPRDGLTAPKGVVKFDQS